MINGYFQVSASTESFKTADNIHTEYQPSGAGHTCLPPAKSKMAARGPQNGRRVWKGVYP